jgi:PII-like signaling protein
MADVTQLAPRLQVFFTQTAEAIARKTKFVQRKSKMTGALFLQSVVFGFEEQPSACLTDLIETSEDLGVTISKQGMQERIQDAVPFLREMFEQGLRLFRHELPLEAAVLKQFKGIFITDSTVIALPESLRQEFPGCGGSGSDAAAKIQLTFELLCGAMDTVDLQTGRSADQGYAGHVQAIRPGALYLSDLGYFVLRHFQQIAQQQAYFLSRFDLKTAIFDPETGKRLDLLAWLREQTQTDLETEWLVGVQEKLPCRVIVVKLPQEVADRRRQKAQENAGRKGRTLSPRHLELLGWNIYITNVPAAMLTLQQVLVMYAVRWQVELIFKVWKSQCALDRVAGRRRERILTELYAKLIGIVVTHFLIAPFRSVEREVSAVKVQHLIRRYALRVALSLGSLEQLVTVLDKLLTRCCKSALKDKRRKRPSTLRKLQTVGAC